MCPGSSFSNFLIGAHGVHAGYRGSVVLIVRVVSGIDTLVTVPIFELAAVVGPHPSIDARSHHDTVRFDVFRWQDGLQQKESFDVGPGDAIGREMAGVDFGTGWRLVDVRPDAKRSDTVAILVNDDGEIERRSFQSDQKDALYQKLKTEADAAKAITASANAR